MIRYFVNNPVAVNILMAAVIFFGLFKGATITREFFPQADLDRVIVRIPFPGATPEEVEKTIVQKVENALEGLQGIDEVTSQAQENAGVIIIKIKSDQELSYMADEIRKEVDTIDDFPEDAEEPIVEELEQEVPAISLVVYGSASERQLKRTAERIEDDLLAYPDISKVLVGGVRAEEISIEVDPRKLEAYDLTFQEIGDAVRNNNLDMAGGEIKSPRGTMLIRTLGESTKDSDLEKLIIRNNRQGSAIRLGDIANVKDDFQETALRGMFQEPGEGVTLAEGERAVQLVVFKRGDEDAINISNQVKKYIEENKDRYEGDAIKLGYRVDLARLIQERIDLMTRNAAQGLVLVFIALALFLNLRLAIWVSMGLAVSFLGTFILMDFMGATINMISLFGLIIVIGIIVDDGIVVAENIYGKMEEGMPKHEAAVQGAEEVLRPVIATVLTTIVAFAPLAFMEGVVGDFLSVIPIVVVAALTLSLLECFIIMPSHLAEYGGDPTPEHRSDEEKSPHFFSRIFGLYNKWKYLILDQMLVNIYISILKVCLKWRYLTLSSALFVALFTIALLSAGYLPFVLFQKVDGDTLVVELEMTNGTPAEQTEAALARIVEKALEFPEIKSVYSVVGFREESELKIFSDPAKIGEVVAEISPSSERTKRGLEIANEWREKVGPIAGAVKLKFRERSGGPVGAEILIQVRGDNPAIVEEAVRYTREKMEAYVGVIDIEDDGGSGKLEMRIRMNETGRALGLSEMLIAQQVRGAFFGFEAQDLQRNNDELKVWVRLDRESRESMLNLLNLRIRTPEGDRVPLSEVADIEMQRGVPTITRVDGRRTTTIQADVDFALANTNEVTASLEEDLADISMIFPGVSASFEGAKKETAESIGSLQFGFPVALILIYCVLAVLFKNYLQPLLIMSVIPFAIFGAMLGHLLYGLIPTKDALPVTFLSLIGMVGLSGIVVNDSLILINFINDSRRRNHDTLFHAIIMAGRRRFRPIVLTSITTVFGLFPLLLETSFQAQFLIPMAVSISFGLALATMLTLLLLPCLYMALEDLRTVVHWLITGEWRVVKLSDDEPLAEESKELQKA